MSRSCLISGAGIVAAAMLGLGACQGDAARSDKVATVVTGETILAADKTPEVWLSHGRTYDEQRYSPLSKINEETVGQMGLAWSFDLDTNRGQEATPLMIDGVLYLTSAWSKVFALDARTGKQLWTFDPKVPGETGFKACCDVVNRGVAAWGDKLFFGTLDGRLIALDRVTGKQLWSTVTVDQSKPYTITGAPRVIDGKVLIGNGGGEYGVRGYIAAYDQETGKQLWKFYTVPGDPAKPQEGKHLEVAAKTWTGAYWKMGGGGTVWDSMAYDKALDLLYIGVGNGSPWNQFVRSPGGGDNLYISSIVALRPSTGEYVWHYQTTPGETWDFTATQHMILADLKINGEDRKVIMQAPKNGFFYVLDRTNGKLISTKNFVPVTWAKGADPKTGRMIETPGARYGKDGKPVLTLPSALGAHNWQPMAFNPTTKLVYIPAQDLPAMYAHDPNFKYREGAWNPGVDFVKWAQPEDPAALKALKPLVKGHLAAWDPVAQKEAWRVQYTGPWNGGVLTTGGNLVFQGTADARFVAYRATDGKKLWEFPTQTGVIAPAMTYELDGEQYVTVLAGWGGAYAVSAGIIDKKEVMPNVGRVLTFKVGAKGTLPKLDIASLEMPIPDLPTTQFSVATITAGKKVYMDNCSVCHGDSAISGSSLPDLRTSAYLTDQAAFNSVVLEGALNDNGMMSFAKWVSPKDSENVRAWLISRSRLLAAERAQATGKTAGGK
jgi:PQQ-dependent dehydrogenase (methanol/ethanol family)